MTDITSTSIRPFRALARVMRAMAWLGVALLVLLMAVWCALHFWIVPRIDDFRPRIAALSSQALGAPLSIGHIEARSNGFVPSFEVRDVRVTTPQGAPGLDLPRVLVSLSLRSLFKLGFEQVYLDRPLLRIHRSTAGRISVGGIDLSDGVGGDGHAWAADWFFSQPEFVVNQAQVHWQDDAIAAPLLSLSDVTLVMRNGARSHQMRLDATPAEGWGRPFVLMGDFKRPLWALDASRWQDWRGQAYADFPLVDVSRLRHHVRMQTQVHAGYGALRAWMSVAGGQWQNVTTDLALPEVSLSLAPDLAPLTLRQVQGRLGAERVPHGWAVNSRGLKFHTAEGQQWPGGNVDVRWQPAHDVEPAQGEVVAAQLDLKALAQIAERLPMQAEVHRALREMQPQGQVQNLKITWAGALDALTRYSAAGRISGLTLLPQDERTTSANAPGRPGVSNANIEIELTERGGRAALQMPGGGTLHFPGVFEDPTLRFDRLQAQGRWTVDGERIAIPQIQVQFANPDVTGQATIDWRTSDKGERFPGVIGLSGQLKRADAARVHRYLPQSIAADVRHYVRDAVQRGELSNVAVRISGPLDDMPSSNPKVGEFRFAGQLHNAHYAYVPRPVDNKNEKWWPALTGLNGEIVFDRMGMQLKGVQAKVEGLPNVVAQKVSAEIADFNHTKVVVNGQLNGPLTDLLGVVQRSPLSAMLSHALDQARAQGDAQVQLGLQLPLADINRSTVTGRLQFKNNDLALSPDAPKLQQVNGVLNFSERGVVVSGVQARMLGGPVRIDGGLNPSGGGANQLRAQGQFQAAALAQWPTLARIKPLLDTLKGGAAYQATLGFQHGLTELSIQSPLQGVTVALPEPLGKAQADAPLPLSIQRRALAGGNAISGSTDEWRVHWGQLASATLQRDLAGATSRLLRGSVAVGAPEPALPAQGLQAVLRTPRLNVDTWTRALADAQSAATAPTTAIVASTAETPAADDDGGGNAAPPPGARANALSYWPDRFDVGVADLLAQGHRLTDVRLVGSREGLLWRGDLQSKEAQGQVDVRQAAGASPGRVHARLKRLHLAADQADRVEQALSTGSGPLTMPALDVEAESFELRGRALGKLTLQAVNRGTLAHRQWRLNKLQLTVPEGQMTASGQWMAAAPGGARRTDLDVQLHTSDAGKLLTRLGLPGTVRNGKGQLTGRIGWPGSPLSMDTARMDGQLDLNIENGQFLKADPGAAKLLGVLSLQSLPRRLSLDFRDVFSPGFMFDFIRGQAIIQAGVVRTNNLQMKGVNAAVLLEGQANLNTETQNLRVLVAPELNAGTASLVTAIINPVVGLSTFFAQLVLRQPLIEAATQEFKIDGTWSDPKVTRVPRRKPAANAVATTAPAASSPATP